MTLGLVLLLFASFGVIALFCTLTFVATEYVLSKKHRRILAVVDNNFQACMRRDRDNHIMTQQTISTLKVRCAALERQLDRYSVKDDASYYASVTETP